MRSVLKDGKLFVMTRTQSCAQPNSRPLISDARWFSRGQWRSFDSGDTPMIRSMTCLAGSILAALVLAACGTNDSRVGRNGPASGDACEQVGAEKLADDGCNTCTCTEAGEWECTEKDCAEGCVYEGEEYEDGESFPASDGCNTCTCSAGRVGCTLMACAEACTQARACT